MGKQGDFSVVEFLISKFEQCARGTEIAVVDVDVYKEVYVDAYGLGRKVSEIKRKLGECCFMQSRATGLISTWDHLVYLVLGNKFQNKPQSGNSKLLVTGFGAIYGC